MEPSFMLKKRSTFLTIGLGLCVLTACQSPNKNNVSTVFIHKYGVTLTENDWNIRGKNGQIVVTRADGTIVTKNYVEGMLEGATTFTFPHSFVIQKEEFYRQDHLLNEVHHYTSGVPKKKLEFLSPAETQITTWFESGTPQYVEKWKYGKLFEGEYFASDNEVEATVTNGHGVKVRRNAYGEYLSKMEVSNGDIIENTTYHRNGDPHVITPYKDTKVHGTRKQYLVNGIPDCFETWVNGIKEGLTVVYLDGVPHREIPYVKDKKNGVQVTYNSEGQVVEEITWKDDLKNGVCKTYIQDVVRIEWYYKGKKVSKSDFEKFIHTPQTN
jgi:antitoxin component YwqK of YwqJK toxin-antitoxin module